MSRSSGGPLGPLGRRARRWLCIVLVAVSAALLLRPVLLLTAALGDDGDAALVPAVVATAFHVTIFVLALTLLRRTSAP